MTSRNVERLRDHGPSTGEELPNKEVTVDDRANGVWSVRVSVAGTDSHHSAVSVYYLRGDHDPADVLEKWVSANGGRLEAADPDRTRRVLSQELSGRFEEAIRSVELPRDGLDTLVGHCQHDNTTVYAGRGPGGRDMLDTPIGDRGWLGNPFPAEEHGREKCVRRFRSLFEDRIENDPLFRGAVEDLVGEKLGCWCQRLDEDGPACHAEVVAEWADRLAAGEEP